MPRAHNFSDFMAEVMSGGLLFVTPNPEAVIGQLHDMAHYLREDGWPGFWMWMQERYPELKELTPDVIQENLQRMVDVTHQYGGNCEQTGKM